MCCCCCCCLREQDGWMEKVCYCSTVSAISFFLAHSGQMNLVPPIPVIGLLQAVQRLEKSSPKQSAQYGLSSLEVKRCPARDFWQWVQVKHSRCQGSLR